jgi:catechol 2,3-dioxygenase-like lactoylglutathione lyase family enzyme
MMEELIDLETAMWQADTRGDRAWMERHLAPGFREFGRSGARWSRDEILQMEIAPIDARLDRLRAEPLADDVALVTYRTTVRGEHVNRSSIWRRVDGRWLLEFHQGTPTDPAAVIGLVTVIVRDYDEAIRFFVDALGFELVEDSPARTGVGAPKRWVVVRPAGEATGLLLALADGDAQLTRVGDQHGGRVGFFLRVADFDTQYARMHEHGVRFDEEPRHEPYGTVVVFRDVAGNRWDLLGPARGAG